MTNCIYEPKFILENIYKPGCVILYHHPNFPEKPHFFFLLNNNPLEHPEHLFVKATSKGEDKIHKYMQLGIIQPETVIFLKPGECNFITKTTIINCNDVFVFTSFEMMQIFKDQSIVEYHTVSQEILGRIRQSTKASRHVKRKYKTYF